MAKKNALENPELKATRQKYLITSALPYANGPLHVGHLLEYIQTDVYVRFLKSLGQDVLYICASDMHGTPIEINAQKAGKNPEQFALEFWQEHQHDFQSYLIHFDNYYKTHSPENKELAEFFFSELKKKKLIYTKAIKVVYCEHCQRTLPDRYVKGQCPHCHAEDQYGDICEKCGSVIKGIDLINPYCVVCQQRPIHKESTHYFFKLHACAPQLSTWINDPHSNLQPEVKNWLQHWLTDLDDWCVSRDAPYFGFEIPGSKKETGETKYFYVWLDAPIGYISSTKNYCDHHGLNWQDYWRQGQVHHFIGKDIAYFHYLFWPAMLINVGFNFPQLTTHGFITVNGEKMSKSRGTFFTAKDFLKLYSAEQLRFYYAAHLDRKVVDVDLNFADFQSVINTVLVGNLGNFCYRTLVFAEKNYGAIKPSQLSAEPELETEVSRLSTQIKDAYAHQDYKTAVKLILQIADLGNAYFQKAEPWTDPSQKISPVAWCVNLARNLSILIAPILPEFSVKIQTALGEKNLQWQDLNFRWNGQLLKVEKLVDKVEQLPEIKAEFPLQLKVGKIIAVKDHPQAEKLLLLTVDFGTEKRQVVAGLKKHFTSDQLLNRVTTFCTNLKKAKLRGEWSEAMILIADDGQKLTFLSPQQKIGEEILFTGLAGSKKEITFEEFQLLKMTVQAEKVQCNGKFLEGVTVKGAQDGARIA